MPMAFRGRLLLPDPAPPGDTSPVPPTGTVINQSSGFKVGGFASQFLFYSEDGTISGWYNAGNAILAVNVR